MKLRRTAKLLTAAMAAMIAMAVAGLPAQAATPATGYEGFAGCPSQAENPNISACLRSVVKSGHFQMGNKDVPITQQMVLSGGANGNLEGFSFTSKGGLSAAKQKVPGGVVGLTGLTWLLEILGSEALTLYAVTELAGTPDLSGADIYLPIKVHLINGVLGNNCYVGSNSNPIKLHLTQNTTNPPAPNQPISGSPPQELEIDPTYAIFHARNATVVDNAFAAPGASGCVLTLFGFIPISINGLVNSQSGLPAAAGTNETVQVTDLDLAAVESVYP